MALDGIFGGLKLVSGPSSEPVTLALARTWLKRGDTAEDTTIGALISAARGAVEADTGHYFGTQIVDLALNAFPDGRAVSLPVTPLQAVVSVTTYDEGDVAIEDTTLTDYVVDTYGSPPRLCLKTNSDWPDSLRTYIAAVIRLRVGWAGTAVSISSMTRSGATVTVTCAAAHGRATGDVVAIAGADQADYNGTFDITVTSTTQFTFTVTGTPVTPATGTMTATPSGVPAWAALAIRMRLAQFSENREGFTDAEQRLYDWLIGPQRMVWLA